MNQNSLFPEAPKGRKEIERKKRAGKEWWEAGLYIDIALFLQSCALGLASWTCALGSRRACQEEARWPNSVLDWELRGRALTVVITYGLLTER